MSSSAPAERLPVERRNSGLGLPYLRAAWFAAGLATFVSACAVPPPPPLVRREGTLGIEIESPAPASTLTLRTLEIPVRGRVRLASMRAPEPVDVFVLVDVSEATRSPSGLDVDGDGEVGFDPHRVLVGLEPGGIVCTDPEDSILHAERAAVQRLLDHLDVGRDRVGLAFFSTRPGPATPSPGDGGLPLGSRFEDVRTALERDSGDETPAHSFEEALRTGERALQGGRAAAHRALLVLQASPAEGPTGPSTDEFEVVPFAVTGAGRSAHGVRPLRRPVDVLAWLAPLDASDGGSIAIANDSLGSRAGDAFLARDGRFSGRVGVRAGSNRLKVSARVGASAGAAGFDLDVVQDLPTPWELLQQLEETERRNKALIRLIEGVEERGPGELEIKIDR